IRGKGLDYSLVAKDYNLIKWIGANSFRTSHYPYAEEIMDFADRQGIVVINECPSVDTVGFSSILLQKHKDSLSELIRRDKNRPSVIMWSIANEARTHLPAAGPYFKSIVEHVKSLDQSRPVTIVTARGSNEDKAAQYVDIIGFNRYNGWYTNPGRTNTIVNNLIDEVQNWHRNFNKPIIIMEYGADTMPGLHLLNSRKAECLVFPCLCPGYIYSLWECKERDISNPHTSGRRNTKWNSSRNTSERLTFLGKKDILLEK
ncbi:unnamed protein product, partial [Timema podura]|nr:unnamed protein product [Timema podura]